MAVVVSSPMTGKGVVFRRTCRGIKGGIWAENKQPAVSLVGYRKSSSVIQSGQQAQVPGFANGLLPAVNAQLAVDVAGMHLDRLSRDENSLGNFKIG